MPPKRRKRSPAPNQGLAPGESLKRYLVPTRNLQSTLWTWVGSDASNEKDITSEHYLIACGLSTRNNYPFCLNKYKAPEDRLLQAKSASFGNFGRDAVLDDNVIVISDDEGPVCTKKTCKENPNCLNYLGQDKWENEENAARELLKAEATGLDPTEDNRSPSLPVGLRNLGATCYANASLQVWFRNLIFRKAVYQCQPQRTAETPLKDSPLFQLQVTFAALQVGSRKVFDPTSLVESLQLRAAEQQDAQEFSKLFMSHLDTEFKMQAVPELRNLVSDQFQGRQVYGTVCDMCQYRSEKTNEFLEIEIRFEGNAELEDCIATMLQEEKLTGDNQYRCPQCNDLRDATRYTQLSQLPPVLNFSLLRFVYDFSTMERKKSKHTVSFPTRLSMDQFLKHSGEGGDQGGEPNTYVLAGVLLHKGASAYHGHYEAQAYDTEHQSWFQFNDELVTKIKDLGDTKGSKGTTIVVDEEAPSNSESRRPAKKRRRLVSDDEIETSQPKPTTSKIISSKDAYMLIYVRQSDQSLGPKEAPKPLQQALEYVDILNQEHEKQCKSFIEKQELIKSRFALVRQQVMDIYKAWNATSVDSDCVIVSSKWLQNWLTQDCIRLAKPTNVETKPEDEGEKQCNPSNDDPSSLPSDDSIFCVHKLLDTTKAKRMKRIRRDIYEKMVELTGCRHEPLLSPKDVCRDCLLAEFKERLYLIEHPKLVKAFEEVSEVQEGTLGYWISKRWIKDWKLLKPKMHQPSQEDPAPDSPEYRGDVWCEHGALALNNSNRRTISEKGLELLKGLYPFWKPPTDDEQLCADCDARIRISKEDKKESKRRAEEEKASLKELYEGTPFTEADDNFAIIPTEFFKGWVAWLDGPADHPRLDKLDNSGFLCDHGSLSFDPNCASDAEMNITFIRQSDWATIENLYGGGPRIGVRKAKRSNDDELRYETDIPVCEGCCLKRRTEWASADIIVQFVRGKKTETWPNNRPVVTYSNKNGTRHSKRLRQARENEKRRFAVTKNTTVKDIKVKVQEGFKIPTICQRLFFRGQELDDNEATVEDLQMFANEVLDLREVNETHEVDSDSDGQPNKKRRTETERGFGGTVLSGGLGDQDSSLRQSSDSCEDTPVGFSPLASEKMCTACTLLNAYNAVACKVCDTVFE